MHNYKKKIWHQIMLLTIKIENSPDCGIIWLMTYRDFFSFFVGEPGMIMCIGIEWNGQYESYVVNTWSIDMKIKQNNVQFSCVHAMFSLNSKNLKTTKISLKDWGEWQNFQLLLFLITLIQNWYKIFASETFSADSPPRICQHPLTQWKANK